VIVSTGGRVATSSPVPEGEVPHVSLRVWRRGRQVEAEVVHRGPYRDCACSVPLRSFHPAISFAVATEADWESGAWLRGLRVKVPS
jgi:hypothetical protein